MPTCGDPGLACAAFGGDNAAVSRSRFVCALTSKACNGDEKKLFLLPHGQQIMQDDYWLKRDSVDTERYCSEKSRGTPQEADQTGCQAEGSTPTMDRVCKTMMRHDRGTQGLIRTFEGILVTYCIRRSRTVSLQRHVSQTSEPGHAHGFSSCGIDCQRPANSTPSTYRPNSSRIQRRCRTTCICT